MIAVYVDDLIIAAKSAQAIDSGARDIAQHFKMRLLGDISFYLGCHIIQDQRQGKLWMVQDAYIEQLLQKHHMQDAKPVFTAMEVNNKLSKAPQG